MASLNLGNLGAMHPAVQTDLAIRGQQVQEQQLRLNEIETGSRLMQAETNRRKLIFDQLNAAYEGQVEAMRSVANKLSGRGVELAPGSSTRQLFEKMAANAWIAGKVLGKSESEIEALLQEALTVAGLPPESTDRMADVRAAAQLGATREQQIRSLLHEPGAPPTTTINVDLSPRIEQAAIDESGRADVLRRDVADMERFREVVAQTESGFFTPITLPIRAALADLPGGWAVTDEQVTLQQVFQANASKMALAFRNPESGFGLTGNTSNRDLDFLKTIPPGLEKTRAANVIILTSLIANARKNAMLADAKAEYLSTNNSIAGWNKVRDRIIKEVDLFTEEDRQMIHEAIAGVGWPQLGTVEQGYRYKGGDPSQKSSWERVQ